MLNNPRFGRVHVEVADHDHRHQLRSVPFFVEAAQCLCGRIAHDLHVADRVPLLVAGAAEQKLENLFVQAAAGVLVAQTLLFDHHASLQLHLICGNRRAAGPVLGHLERLADDLLVVGRELKEVDGFVEGGVGVDVRPEGHADALKVGDQLLLWKALGAVEHHVLEEVGQAKLVLVLLDRAGVDHQHQCGPVGRLRVVPDVVGQPVVQLYLADLLVQRQHGVQIQDLAVEVGDNRRLFFGFLGLCHRFFSLRRFFYLRRCFRLLFALVCRRRRGYSRRVHAFAS